MDFKKNQLMIGIIALLVGIFLLVQRSFFNYSILIFIFMGVAFMLLYVTKRKSWALIVGVYSSWYAISETLFVIFNHRISFNISYATFFIATSIIFYILYYSKNKTGLLIPASMLFWFGINTILSNISTLSFYNMQGLLFMICTGMAFYTAYFLARGFIGRWALYIGTIFVFIGCCFAFGYGSIFVGIKNMVALIFIGASIIIILRAIRKK